MMERKKSKGILNFNMRRIFMEIPNLIANTSQGII